MQYIGPVLHERANAYGQTAKGNINTKIQNASVTIFPFWLEPEVQTRLRMELAVKSELIVAMASVIARALLRIQARATARKGFFFFYKFRFSFARSLINLSNFAS